jgi:glutaredoxin
LKYQAELRKTMQSRLSEGRKIDSAGVVSLFGATWCGYCKRAKSYLQAKGIRYREYDIDTAEGGRAFVEAGGQKGVPLLVADGKRLQGFTEGSYDGFFSARK